MSRPGRIAVACACGRRMTVRSELAGTKGRCPSCGALLEVPTLDAAALQRTTGRPAKVGAGRSAPRTAAGSTCSICQTVIDGDEEAVGCQQCELPYHVECWDEYGGCAAYGCENAPKVEKKPEEARKECPYCAETIPAKALRCPSCRERFEDARPVDREEYIHNLIAEPERKRIKGKAIGILAASLLPCAGPVILIIGVLWLQNGAKDFEEAGEIYRVVVKAAASMGGIHTILMLLFFAGLAVA